MLSLYSAPPRRVGSVVCMVGDSSLPFSSLPCTVARLASFRLSFGTDQSTPTNSNHLGGINRHIHRGKILHSIIVW